MGTTRKYGLMLVIIIGMFFVVTLPDFILSRIPSFTGNPLDLIIICMILMLVGVFYKG